MQKPSNLIFLGFLIGCLGLTASCNDEEVMETEQPERAELLAGQESKTWTLQSFYMNGSDVTSFLDECDIDDHYVLYRNGDGEVLSNEIRCEEDEPSTLTTGNWELHENQTSLSINLPPFLDEDVEITELTADKLQVRQLRGEDTITGTFQAVN